MPFNIFVSADRHSLIGNNGKINGHASCFTFCKEANAGLVFMSNGGFPLDRTSAPALLEKILEMATEHEKTKGLFSGTL